MSHIGNGSPTAAVLGSLSPEEADMLRDAFIYMDRDNDGHVDKGELLAMVRRCVGEERFGPLEEYLVPLFDVADKDKDQKLSLTEFLMSFADGPGVVPAEVINSCVSSIRVRLSDEEIETLQETFRRIDTKADGYIDKDELIVALKDNLKHRFPDLRDNNYSDIIAVIMASADADRDGRLCLSEFIRSFQEDQGVLPAAFVDAHAHQLVQQLTPAEIEVLKEAFAVLDRNHDGYVESTDIYDALWETLSSETQDKSQIREICDLIMVTADRNNSGLLTLADFVRGFVQNITLAQLPVAAAEEKMQRACEKLQEMLESGELERLSVLPEDKDENASCVDPNQLLGVLSEVFRDVFPMLDEETLAAVMGAIVVASDNEGNKKISVEDFIRCFAEGPRILSFDSTTPLESSTVTDEELQTISQVLQELGKEADSGGCVQEPDLLEAIRNAFRSDPKQADRVLQYVRENIVRRNSSSSLVVEASARSVPCEEERSAASNVLAAADLNGESAELNSQPDPKQKQPEQKQEPEQKQVQDQKPEQKQEQDQKPEHEQKQQQKQQQEQKTDRENDQRKITQDNQVALRETTGVGATQPKQCVPTLLAVRTPPKSVAVRAFGTSSTVSDMLMKQHARLYLGSVYDTADGAIFDDELRMEFKKYANENQQYIDRDRFVKAYLAMEHYGLTPSETDVNRLISRYSRGNKITYDEFCIIMLQRARM
ncbi:putative calmodulin [Trypanosoma grayi]|uniref:putative calmodulin n=1 Tax=Trypanosoma grayi TaxID=71804 RepID=UPI0004F43F80|nr:putative calmodulin [Trypanosoma grayi]KEG15489.1 putative calmodulin [Trypanosoma grayi]